jgi:hypothetical protein
VPTEEREQLYCRVLAETELTEAYVLPPCQVVQGPADDDAPSSEPTEATAAQAPARDDQPTDAEGTGTGEATVVPFVQQGLVGPGRSHVPAEMAAERLRAQLAEVRSRPQREAQGPAGQQPKVREELLGMQASIDVHADGLAGEPLSLFWRLSAAPGADVLPATWVTPVLASQLQPETNSEVAALNFWIPLPRNPGPFVLDVFVVREADGELLGSQRLEPVA